MVNSLKNSPEMMKKHSWAETGTTIFAFLNVITASFGLMICVGVLILFVSEAVTHADSIDAYMTSACLSINFIAIVSFVFAILLHLGIHRKRPGFVLAYVIFGAITVVSLICCLIALQQNLDSEVNKKLHEAFWDYYDTFIYTIIGICIVYGLLLTMICRTWFVMKTKRSDDHVILVSDDNESDWRAD